MITRDSRLIPSQVKAQSESAIAALETDNEHLSTAIREANSFIINESNRAESFDRVRQKMGDYIRVANALTQANDADIADHRKLIASVGASDEDLIGWHIITERARNALDEITANNRAANYARIRNELLAGRTHIVGLPTPVDSVTGGQRSSLIALMLQNMQEQERLRDIAAEAVRRYDEKKALYESIENETKNLFTYGADLRAEAVCGVEVIQAAKAGLPDSYYAEGLSEWRGDIALAKERLLNQMDDRLIAGFFDEDGVLDLDAVIDLFISTSRDVTDIDLQTLFLLFRDHLTPEQMVIVYGQGGGNHLIADEQAVAAHQLMQRLAAKLSEQFMQDTEAHIWTGTVSYDDLTEIMMRAQLVTFLGSLGPGGADVEGAIDLRQFENGTIYFLGIPYSMSSTDSLLYRATDELNNALNEIIGRGSTGEKLLALALKAVKPVGATLTALEIFSLAFNYIQNDSTLTPAQRTAASTEIANAIQNLGGGMAFVNTPGGIQIVGTTLSTPQAMINLAGIEQVLGIPQIEIFEILSDPEHDRFDEVRGFTLGRDGYRYDFIEDLPNDAHIYSYPVSELQEILESRGP